MAATHVHTLSSFLIFVSMDLNTLPSVYASFVGSQMLLLPALNCVQLIHVGVWQELSMALSVYTCISEVPQTRDVGILENISVTEAH